MTKTYGRSKEKVIWEKGNLIVTCPYHRNGKLLYLKTLVSEELQYPIAEQYAHSQDADIDTLKWIKKKTKDRIKSATKEIENYQRLVDEAKNKLACWKEVEKELEN